MGELTGRGAGLAGLLAVLVSGCAGYAGSARPFSPTALTAEPGWVAVPGVPLVTQRSESDCGAAAIAMVVSWWTGRDPAVLAEALRPAPPEGFRAGHLREVARRRGLDAFVVRGELGDLERELAAGRPVLVGLVKPQRDGALTHYEVVVGLHPARRLVVTLDPAAGWRQNSIEGFVAEWEAAGGVTLVVTGSGTGTGTGTGQARESSYARHMYQLPIER
jgi:ABC-type bacteriocin/lantibiotic exporter with double-glycine peptidase domain